MMKIETNERMNKLLDALEKSITDGSKFVAEEAPEIVKEFLFYHRTTGMVISSLLFLAIICSVYVFRWSFRNGQKVWPIKEWDKNVSDKQFVYGMICFLSVIGLGFSFASFICMGLETFKVFCAPRVFLIEELSRLLK